MLKVFKNVLYKFLLLGTLILVFSPAAYAQTPTETSSTVTPTPDKSKEVEELNKKITELEGKISESRSQQSSLNSQISTMDNQIKLTEYRINATQQEITDLALDIDSATKRMKNLEGSLNAVSKVLINRIVATYQAGGNEQLNLLFAVNDIDDLVSKATYLRVVQAHDKRLMYDAQQARNDYANQKTIFEGKKKKVLGLQTQLEDYTEQLDKDKADKQKLLADTKGNEANYQKMLSQAQAQLAGFSRFATSQGGASIIPAMSSSDGWYYNQRDERWGRNSIGSSGEPVWKYGCLLTSVAMLLKQRGEGVTPQGVAANSGYFFASTAYMNIPWAGGRFSASWQRNLGDIDAKLAAGKPVIVGLNAGQYGTHFIVLKSGSGGNYIMHDPWNGPDLNFSSYYSTGQIFQYGWYNG